MKKIKKPLAILNIFLILTIAVSTLLLVFSMRKEEEEITQSKSISTKMNRKGSGITAADMFENNDTGTIKIGDYVKYNPNPVTLTNDSPMIENLTDYSGNTNASYNKADSIIQEELEWKVLDKKDGKIRLISEVPTTSMISLEGAKGYNNAVKLLDDFCSELYSNNLAENVQSAKIEDIEGKMNLTTWDYHSFMGGYKYGNYGSVISSANRNYPRMFYDEDGQRVNGSTHGSIGVSEQTNYISEGAVTATTSINAKQTYWDIDALSFTAANFTNAKYYDLLIKEGGVTNHTYYLASRGVSAFSSFASYHLRCVIGGRVFGNSLMLSNEVRRWCNPDENGGTSCSYSR